MSENTIKSEEAISASENSSYVKRKQMYVKRQFQKSMLLQSILITFIIVNAIIMTVFWAIDSFSDLQRFKSTLSYAIVAIEIVGFVVLYKLNLQASHRIAGPIFSMERCLGNIEQGDLTGSLKLRKTDQFPETAEQLNATLASVRTRYRNIRNRSNNCRSN